MFSHFAGTPVYDREVDGQTQGCSVQKVEHLYASGRIQKRAYLKSIIHLLPYTLIQHAPLGCPSSELQN